MQSSQWLTLLMGGLSDWANFVFFGQIFKEIGQIIFIGIILLFLGKK